MKKLLLFSLIILSSLNLSAQCDYVDFSDVPPTVRSLVCWAIAQLTTNK